MFENTDLQTTSQDPEEELMLRAGTLMWSLVATILATCPQPVNGRQSHVALTIAKLSRTSRRLAEPWRSGVEGDIEW